MYIGLYFSSTILLGDLLFPAFTFTRSPPESLPKGYLPREERACSVNVKLSFTGESFLVLSARINSPFTCYRRGFTHKIIQKKPIHQMGRVSFSHPQNRHDLALYFFLFTSLPPLTICRPFAAGLGKH